MADAHIHNAVADATLGGRDGNEIDVAARAQDDVDDGDINVRWIDVGSSILPPLDGDKKR